ncbi:MAG: hypothetical protein KDK50_05930 [Chlamydiia bacterium]|nr:hypothetical protein [Chlamydiia bacterium]MCP5492052.1 hypothetical protein [Chlamydiales bacterium]
MDSFIEQFLQSDRLYWAAAIGGSFLFVLRLGLMIFGLAHDDHQSASDGDHDGHFKLFTVHSLTGFTMMFGWIGLACLKQTAIGAGLSCVAALAAGVLMLFITGWIFRLAGMLTSKGADFNIQDMVGVEGQVYTKIAENGTGKVHLSVHGVLHELLAVAEDKQEIKSFERISVVRILDEQTVVVKKW